MGCRGPRARVNGLKGRFYRRGNLRFRSSTGVTALRDMGGAAGTSASSNGTWIGRAWSCRSACCAPQAGGDLRGKDPRPGEHSRSFLRRKAGPRHRRRRLGVPQARARSSPWAATSSSCAGRRASARRTSTGQLHAAGWARSAKRPTAASRVACHAHGAAASARLLRPGRRTSNISRSSAPRRRTWRPKGGTVTPPAGR